MIQRLIQDFVEKYPDKKRFIEVVVAYNNETVPYYYEVKFKEQKVYGFYEHRSGLLIDEQHNETCIAHALKQLDTFIKNY